MPVSSPAPLRDLPSVFHAVPLREGGDALARAVALAPGGAPAPWPGSAPMQGRKRRWCWSRNCRWPRPGWPSSRRRMRWPMRWWCSARPRRRWPCAGPAPLLVNGATCGRLLLASPPDAAEAACRHGWWWASRSRWPFRPGRNRASIPARTCLEEEGFEELTAAALTATWARHLMAGLDQWQARGPRRLSEDFLGRLLDFRDEAGLRRGIDPASGALVLERDGSRRHLSLA